MLCPHHWAFYIQGSGVPITCCCIWSSSLCKAHFALQGLQAVVLRLSKMAFHLSNGVVALHLDSSTAKAYLCNPDGTASLFFPD